MSVVRSRKRARVEPLHEKPGGVNREIARDERLAVRDDALHRRRLDELAIKENGNRFAKILLRHLRENLRAFGIERDGNLRCARRLVEGELGACDVLAREVRRDVRLGGRRILVNVRKLQKRRLADFLDCVGHALHAGKIHDKLGRIPRLRRIHLRFAHAEKVHALLNHVPQSLTTES